MKILIVSNHFYPYIGGLEKFTLELAKGLADKGHEVDVMTYQTNKTKLNESKDNFKIIRIPCKEILGGAYSLPRIFNKNYHLQYTKIVSKKYDVVFTNTRFFTASYLGCKIANKIGAKYIHIEHGNKFVQHKNPLVTLAAWIYDQSMGRYVITKADLNIGISKKCAEFTKKLGAKKTKIIHNSVHVKKFSKAKIKNKKQLTIVYVGRLIFAKGVQHIIEAISNKKEYQLDVIGDGPYLDKLKRLSKDVNSNVKFLGLKNENEVKEILANSDIFINPSYSEGLPTSVLEAGATGLPIIATNVGGTNEIIDNNINGILIKPNSTNEIKKGLKILQDKTTREKFSKQIKIKIKEKFDWEKTIEKFEEILE